MFWINCIIVIVLLIVLSCMLLFSSPKIVNIAVTVFYAIPKLCWRHTVPKLTPDGHTNMEF